LKCIYTCLFGDDLLTLTEVRRARIAAVDFLVWSKLDKKRKEKGKKKREKRREKKRGRGKTLGSQFWCCFAVVVVFQCLLQS
jgi:hypothetical protein